MKLYVVGPSKDGKGRGNGVYYLITEKGECLASHLCSNSSFAKGDLLLRRPERIKEWKAKYGELDLLFVGDDDMTLETLIKLNQKFVDSKKVK